MAIKVRFFIDESYFKERNIYGVCIVCATSEDIKICEERLEDLEFEGIIMSSGKPYGVLHYVDNDISTRMKVFECMRSMPISAHVAIIEKKSGEGVNNLLYRDVMWKIMTPLMQKQLKSYKQEEIEIIFENVTNSVGKDLSFFKDIFYSRNLKKINISVHKKEKNKINFAPDYVLGIIMEILTFRNKNKSVKVDEKSWMVKAVEIINPKLSVVSIDLSSVRKRFHRKENRHFLDYLNNVIMYQQDPLKVNP